jgi:hypothetical protein
MSASNWGTAPPKRRNDSAAQARRDWEIAIKLARDAEDYWVLDRERRPLATVLALPNVVVYVVQPGAVAETMRDPQIELLFAVGQPILFAFMRREDVLEMRDRGCRAKLAATPTAAMWRA